MTSDNVSQEIDPRKGALDACSPGLADVLERVAAINRAIREKLSPSPVIAQSPAAIQKVTAAVQKVTNVIPAALRDHLQAMAAISRRAKARLRQRKHREPVRRIPQRTGLSRAPRHRTAPLRLPFAASPPMPVATETANHLDDAGHEREDRRLGA